MEFVSTERIKQKIINKGYVYSFQKNLSNNLTTYVHMNANCNEEASVKQKSKLPLVMKSLVIQITIFLCHLFLKWNSSNKKL